MKLWIDDIRPAPHDYFWCKTVNDAKVFIRHGYVELIDIDHDAGIYAAFGGDYIKLLDWLEEYDYNIPIRIHSMNPVGVQNMRAIIQKNHWTEIY